MENNLLTTGTRRVARWSILLGLTLGPVVISVVHLSRASAQMESYTELARRLADANTRAETIATVSSDPRSTRLLISWTRTPPKGVDEYELSIGLADAFSRLKTKDAIPFLIKNINLRRHRYVDLAPWLKTDQAIRDTFPALAALIELG